MAICEISITSLITNMPKRSPASRSNLSASRPSPWNEYGEVRGLNAPPRSARAPAFDTFSAAVKSCSLIAALIIYIRIQLRIPRRVGSGLRCDFLLLNLAHDVHQPLVNSQQISIRQRPLVHLPDIAENFLLTIRLVNRHSKVAFQL